ncbi:MAG TPA: hypothetical protein VGC32_18455 [Solirubrobacterales bacterium]
MATGKWRTPGSVGARAAGAASGASGGSAFKLTATSTGSNYAPTFTGDGVLGVRVLPAGQGYAAGTVPALSELAGFYAQPKGEVQQRANIPTWSTLAFGEGGETFVGVRLRVTPHWSGTATIDDRFDGKPAELNVENKPGGSADERRPPV